MAIKFFVFSEDLWSDLINETDAERSSTAGLSFIGGICGRNRYSVVEDIGLESILVRKLWFFKSIIKLFTYFS